MNKEKYYDLVEPINPIKNITLYVVTVMIPSALFLQYEVVILSELGLVIVLSVFYGIRSPNRKWLIEENFKIDVKTFEQLSYVYETGGYLLFEDLEKELKNHKESN